MEAGCFARVVTLLLLCLALTGCSRSQDLPEEVEQLHEHIAELENQIARKSSELDMLREQQGLFRTLFWDTAEVNRVEQEVKDLNQSLTESRDRLLQMEQSLKPGTRWAIALYLMIAMLILWNLQKSSVVTKFIAVAIAVMVPWLWSEPSWILAFVIVLALTVLIIFISEEARKREVLEQREKVLGHLVSKIYEKVRDAEHAYTVGEASHRSHEVLAMISEAKKHSEWRHSQKWRKVEQRAANTISLEKILESINRAEKARLKKSKPDEMDALLDALHSVRQAMLTKKSIKNSFISSTVSPTLIDDIETRLAELGWSAQ